MQKYIALILSLNLLGSLPASAITLQNVARLLATSSSLNEFIQKAVPDKVRQEELMALARNEKMLPLPKVKLEKEILTLIAGDGTRTSIQVDDAKNGDFRINGQKLKVEGNDSYSLIAKKIETLLNTKTSLWMVFLPLAEAKSMYDKMITVVVTALYSPSLFFARGCNDIADRFRRNIKVQTKNSPQREIVAKKIISCNPEQVEVEYVDVNQNERQEIRAVYSQKSRSQEGFLQTNVIDPKAPKNVNYNFMQNRETLRPEMEFVQVNGVEVTDPQEKKKYQKEFDIYMNSTRQLLVGAGDRCYNCDIDDLNKSLKHRDSLEFKTSLEKDVHGTR